MIEKVIERGLFASRWLMAPFYIGLVVGLVLLLIKFGQELLHFAESVLHATESEVILGILSLIDLSLTANLVLLVIFSGYENFVSRMDLHDHSERPEWMGKIDFSGLKLKLIASIVAISAIQLLKAFMDLNSATDRDLWWMAGIHVVFVGSGVFLALSDWLSDHAHLIEARIHAMHAKGGGDGEATADAHAPDHGGKPR
ncbi:TIGR00645 family protein [Hansschlegelia sp.]|uniref:TIGR00645 family protein n=1 Tax=Hansschlegelia sp. TaxID=2041892 RepID=UPI002C970F4A|nr:TIGR00645 family protein [Hansschlegelia sp.]HVI27267.1 TIGR00645 family protein [Hansschlegelia sp.]